MVKMYLFVRSIRTQTSASTGSYEKMSIAARLRSVLDKKGLSIKEASDLVGIPYRTLQNYLLDEREPNAKALSAIRTHLGISLDWLLTGEGNMAVGVSADSSETRTVNQQEEAILELFRSLGEAGKREIQSAAEEKKRLRDIEQRLEDLSQYEELLFPPQAFMSAGFISDSLECSICGSPYAKCQHLRGRPYMGRFCEINHRNPRGDHAALVDSPADKRCRVTSIQVREGYQDKLSGEITPYEGNELFDKEGPLNVRTILMATDRYPYLASTGKVLGE